MRGFVTISKVPEGPAAPLWCMARTLSPQRDCASPPTRITAGGGVPLCNASETILYVHNPCISFDSCDPQFRVSHHRAHHEGVAQASLWLWLGAPGRIRTCDTRFRKSLDSAYYAVYLRLSYARDSQPSRHTTPDDPGSRHKPCHEARLLPELTRPIITSELRRSGEAHASQLWGFKSEGGLGPNAYTHALFADFALERQK